MTASPQFYLVSAVIAACFTVVFLFGGIAIPVIERSKLNAQIQSDAMLTREESLSWGQVPGIRGINYQKTFTIYGLEGEESQLLQGNINATSVQNATYNYTYTYSNLHFVPSSGGAAQFFKEFNYDPLGFDESVLRNSLVRAPNIGAFRGVNQQGNMSPAQTFVQSLYRLYSSFQQTIFNVLFSDYIFGFYISNQDLTNSTIFMYNQTVTPEVSDQLWNDPEYGWSQSSTLLPWVSLAIGYVGNFNYNPQTVPTYTTLKNHFNLTDDQMMSLIGASNPGKTTPSSLLYLVIVAADSTVAGENQCASPIACTSTELFALQIFQANLTKYPPFNGFTARDSIADLNLTFPAAPEVTSINNQNVPFESTIANSLVDLSGSNPTQTLFGIDNVEFLMQNQNDPQAVATYFGLDNTQQASVLISYVNYLINNFTYQGNPTLLAPLKYAADVAVTNMNQLPLDMGQLISINTTAIGTFNLMTQQQKNCSVLLSDIQPANQTLTDAICSNPDLTLDTAQGHATWVAAYFAGDGSSVYSLIESITGIADSQLQTLLQTSSQIGGNIQTVVNAISTAFGCQGTCDSTYLTKLQWSTSGFTKGLPQPYFTETYETLHDVFPEFFGNFIPEFPVFAARTLDLNIPMTLETTTQLFSYGVGSINNNYEVLRLLGDYKQLHFLEIQNRFGFNYTVVTALLTYFDSAFIDYYMGGVTQTISMYDLLWGYQDPFMTKLNNSNFFETLQTFETQVSLFGNKQNSDEDDSDASTLGMINTGSDSINDVRKVASFKGNSTLSIARSYYDGFKYVNTTTPIWNGSLEYITGTDSSGFPPLLEGNNQITVFEDRFYRNLNYKYQDQIEGSSGSNTYDFNVYKVDPQQLLASTTYYNIWDGYINLTSVDNTPLLISLPYYQGCAANSYTNITFDGQPASTYQASVDPGTFIVESMSGITANFTKNYLYSINNALPYLITMNNVPAAMPVVLVSESYTTPPNNYKSDLQTYYSKARGLKVAMIVVLVFAFLCFVTTGLLIRKYLITRKSQSNYSATPDDYSSLRVASDGARESLYPHPREFNN